MDQIDAGVQTMADAISQYGSWDDVYTVSVGNELVNSGEATPAQVGQYVATARSALTAAGYTGPIVAVDTFIAVIEHPELCRVLRLHGCQRSRLLQQDYASSRVW